MRLSGPVKNIAFFFPPLALWCFLYRGFLWGHFQISEDTFTVYAIIKYFLNQISVGVFPHWNPYLLWGMGQIYQSGELNPIWVLTLLLNALHMDFYHAFVWTIVVYFFIGAWGVYCLFQRLLQEKPLAYFGFICFLFSGVGMTVFSQVHFLLIFVPAIWFFYFLIGVLTRPSVSQILLMVFTLMLIATAYIPFYFFTVLLCAVILAAFIFPRPLKEGIGRCTQFALRHPLLFWASITGLGVAAAVALDNWWALKSHLIALARPAVMKYELAKDAGIPLAEIVRDQSLFSVLMQRLGLSILTHVRDIFSLTNIAYDNQRVFYMPVVLHAVLLATIWARLNKRIVFGWALCFILFLIAIARLTHVYEFLFSQLAYFRLFRNIFFLTPFIVTIYIWVVLEQWRSCGKELPGLRAKRGYSLTLWFLSAVAVIQPITVLSAHARQFQKLDSPIIRQALSSPLAKPQFSYIRPLLDPQDYAHLKPNDLYRLYSRYMITMEDSAGFFTFQYGYPTRWSYALAKSKVASKEIAEYAQHKFVIYPQAQAPREYATLDEFFGQMASSGIGGHYINEASAQLRVFDFNADRVVMRTDFSEPVFLVYNDSYHPRWKAYVDAARVPVQRANYAFKGINVPAGAHDVSFVYQAVGGDF